MSDLFENLDLDAKSFYDTITAVCDDYVYVWDVEKDVFLASPNMVSDYGLTGNRLKHFMETWIGRVHARDRERIRETCLELLESDSTGFSVEYQTLTANGSYIWVSNKAKIRRDAKTGKPLFLLGFIRNLEQYEGVDQVTGLLKFSFCKDKFESTIAGREDFHGEILMLGIDEFGIINTLNCHSFGDVVLRTTAQDILKILPAGADMYRYEGDQFLIAGNGLTREAMLETYARVKEYSISPHHVDGQYYRFTVSGGLIAYPQDARTWSDLEKGASVSLKKAKENGKNQCVEFTHELLRERIDEQLLSYCIAKSVEDGFRGFRLVFQPVCSVETLGIHGAEALLRYQTPDGKGISPEEFIPLMENNRLILPVGLWVLEQAIIACKEWTAELPDFVVNVNVSYVQLRDPDFCDKVDALLQKHRLDIRNLTLELTESYFIMNDSNINDSLFRLKQMQINLAMDDFGTGYSSLGRLAELNVDLVKIDRFFVKALHMSQYNHDFVEAVIRLCHNLGKAVCVEGVETREEWEGICLLKADYVQGYYISRPEEKGDFADKYVYSVFDSMSLTISLDKEKIQRQLVNDKELLFAMMNATPLSLLIWNRGIEILSCNQEAVHLFGANIKEDIIENFFQFSPEYQPNGRSSSDMAYDKITEAFVTGHSQFNWMHCDRWGNQLPVEVISVRIPYQDDFIVASYTRDLRAEIKLEEKNQKFRKRLKALLDATPLCLNLWNKSYQNIMCNQEAVKLFGLESEQEYLSFFFLLSPEKQPDGMKSSEKAVAMIDEAMKKGRIQFKWLHCNLDGEPIPAEITLVRIEGLGDDGSDMVAGYTRDLREQLNAERVEHAMTRRIRAVMDATPLACILWNMREEILDCNHNTVEMFGAKDTEEVIHGFDSFLPLYQPDGSLSSEKKKKNFAEVKKSGRFVFEWVYVSKNHGEIPCEVTLVRAVIKDEEGDIIIAYSRDLRELKRTLEINERLAKLANYDALTGCLSRVHFMEIFSQQFEKGCEHGHIALGIFDIDNFKNINDTYGHEAGDLTLKRVVDKVVELLPPNAFVGRFGGDEFMVLLCAAERETVSEFIKNAVNQIPLIPIRYQGDVFHVSISLGAAYQREEDACPDDLLRRSDAALYEVKRSGRGTGVLM